MFAERPTGIQSISELTAIAVSYGTECWRASQSIVDIVQNCLDAQTSVYERSLLREIGIHEYNPSDPTQQQIVACLESIRSGAPHESDRGMALLQEVKSDLVVPPDLRGRLESVAYQLPKVDLLLDNGSGGKWCHYSDLVTMPMEAEVQGFRVQDGGSGFDHRLLGMMGASTKAESPAKRGGLGEGLRMSLLHLIRSGADVEISSVNRDSAWIVRPVDQEGVLSFEGRERRLTRAPRNTGSTVTVRFSKEEAQADVRNELAAVLDPRRGEGLGKHILEYKSPSFASKVDQDQLIGRDIIPEGGRIYVKNLLVESKAPSYFSYNLANKWAIGGRDRKQIKQPELMGSIEAELGKLADPHSQVSLLQALSSGREFLEMKALPAIELTGTSREGWGKSIAAAFGCNPQKSVFILSESSIQTRRAEATGKEVVALPSNCGPLVSFIQRVFPEHEITIGAGDSEEAPLTTSTLPRRETSSPEAAVTGKKKELQGTDVQPSSIVVSQFERSKQALKNRLAVLPESERVAIGLPDLSNSLENVKVIERKLPEQHSPMLKVEGANVYVAGDRVRQGAASDVAMELAILRAALGCDLYDTRTQRITTSLLGHSLRHGHDGEPIRKGGEPQNFRGSNRYTVDERAEDLQYLEESKLLDRLTGGRLSEPEFEDIMESLRQIDSKTTTRAFIHVAVANDVISIPGNNNPKRLHLSEYTSGKPGLDGVLLQPSGEYTLTKGISYFAPYELAPDSSLLVEIDVRDTLITLQLRNHDGVTSAQVQAEGKPAEYLSLDGVSSWFTLTPITVHTSGSVLKIASHREDAQVQFSVPPSLSQWQEVHRGRDTIVSNVAIDYGRDVWLDPQRVILDDIQNHLDAGAVSVSFNVRGPRGILKNRTAEEVCSLGREYTIVGFTIEDDGPGFPSQYLVGLGLSTKGDNDRGKFGERMKLLAASCYRQGIGVSFRSRDYTATPTGVAVTVTDYETGSESVFTNLGYQLKWRNASAQQGSSTHFWIDENSSDEKPSLPGRLLSLIRREKSADLLRGAISPHWKAWTELVDPRNADSKGRRGIDRFVLPNDETRLYGGTLQVLPDLAGEVYEKGLLIAKEKTPDMCFGYNSNGGIVHTRERNSFDRDALISQNHTFMLNNRSIDYLCRLLDTVGNVPRSAQFETESIAKSHHSIHLAPLLRCAFHETFGDDAILSLRSTRDFFNRHRALDQGNRDWLITVEKAVANEIHLERDNLIHLPHEIATLMRHSVYSSLTFLEDSKAGVEVLTDTEHRVLMGRLQGLADDLADRVENILSTGVNRDSLLHAVSLDTVESRLIFLRNLMNDDIVIRRQAWEPNGECVPQVDDRPQIHLNSRLLSGDGAQLAGVFGHEVLHYLSGEPDYTEHFQHWFMLTSEQSGNR